MTRAGLLAALAAALACVPALADGVLVLSGGTVVDGYGGPPLRNGVIVIEGERITAVGTLDTVVLPPGATAVGRTNQITGSLAIAGTQVTDAEFVVDVASIESDEGRRDGQFRGRIMSTDEFPTATFTLTAPVDVPASALAGSPADVTLVGDLTLHGVTQSVEIPAQAQLVDGQIQVAGSLPIVLADYEFVAPNVGGFIVSIAARTASLLLGSVAFIRP